MYFSTSNNIEDDHKRFVDIYVTFVVRHTRKTDDSLVNFKPIKNNDKNNNSGEILNKTCTGLTFFSLNRWKRRQDVEKQNQRLLIVAIVDSLKLL